MTWDKIWSLQYYSQLHNIYYWTRQMTTVFHSRPIARNTATRNSKCTILTPRTAKSRNIQNTNNTTDQINTYTKIIILLPEVCLQNALRY